MKCGCTQDAAVERVLQFACGPDKAMLGRGDFFVAIHLVYTAHRDRNLPPAPAASAAVQVHRASVPCGSLQRCRHASTFHSSTAPVSGQCLETHASC